MVYTFTSFTKTFGNLKDNGLHGASQETLNYLMLLARIYDPLKDGGLNEHPLPAESVHIG